MKRVLGTCYYPEHWPEEIWAKDAARMADLGLTWVRIGEFAWSRIEPREGAFDWEWLDRAIETLGAAGLKIMLGTPTATPPRWVVGKHPDMIAIDEQGRPRGFGSRRHYCFSHEGFAQESDRITHAVAERYGRNPHIAAWQTDNEYGCHDTVLSWSNAARVAFRGWLRGRYGDIQALNRAWGNVFWSMEYDDFDQIDLPNLTVTEPNPAHAFDFRRFSSDQVLRFNKRQVDIIRAHSDAPTSHNYMGRVTEFDHYAIGDDLDIATWDSYPLGFLEDRIDASPDWQRRFAQQGDPDFQAFHHDLYRSVGKGRWWVVEQQPGPVNWAPHNPAPLPGMVRLWTWEAFAHGAEAVCYFRWRQAPFAQEQMHAGLLRPDHAEAPATEEARQVIAELADAPDVQQVQAPVALIFDYAAEWGWRAEQQGRELSYFGLVFDSYRALRRLGLSVDVVGPEADLTGYALVVAPGLMHLDDRLKTALPAHPGQVLIGPRAGAKTETFSIPETLPPGIPGLDLRVAAVETLRADMPRPVQGGGQVIRFVETLDTPLPPVLHGEDGQVLAVRDGSLTYLGAWLDGQALTALLQSLCETAGIDTILLPDGVRRRQAGAETFWFNYDRTPNDVAGHHLPACSVTRR